MKWEIHYKDKIIEKDELLDDKWVLRTEIIEADNFDIQDGFIRFYVLQPINISVWSKYIALINQSLIYKVVPIHEN